MEFEAFQSLDDAAAQAALLRCCGSTAWARRMAARRPFADLAALLQGAGGIWNDLGPDDWRQAFAAHPRIGDLDSLRDRFGSTASWSATEQAGVVGAGEEVLRALAEGNRRYEEKFGHIFIICASGQTADTMLAALEGRLGNDRDTELRMAAGEQEKITRLRLEKLLS